MPEHIEEMFDKVYPMTDGVKRKAYEKWMADFRERHKETLRGMTESVERAQNREDEAAKIAAMMADAVEKQFSKRGKLSSRKQIDINCFMIYYMFPAILLTQSECAVMLADAVRDEWRVRYKNSRQLDYAEYDTILGSFNEKLLGMF